MEYIFVFNPAAGKNRAALSLIPDIQKICAKCGIEPRIYISRGGEDITSFVASACDGKARRVYAVGGDGTLNRVINAVAGRDDVLVGALPMGTGNDFIRNFALDARSFFDIEKQLDAPAIKCDAIRYGTRYCINICNMGFDANVAVDMPRFKNLPLVSNSAAYNMSIILNVARKLGRHMDIYADGKSFFSGDVLMCAVGNGTACGGGFKVTPLAQTDDGLIDLSVVTPPSRIKLAPFVKHFSAGTQLEAPRLKKYIHYTKCRTVRVVTKNSINLVNDGEAEKASDTTFEIAAGRINFIVPVNRPNGR